MTGNVPFLMKDAVLLAASIYLLKQDVARVAEKMTPVPAPARNTGLRSDSLCIGY